MGRPRLKVRKCANYRNAQGPAMPRFPKWVPEPVACFVERAEGEGHDEKGKERLRRLVSAPDMEPVWRTLSKEAPSPEVLENFARSAAFSLFLGWGRGFLPSVTDAARRRSTQRIEKLARGLLDELAKPGGGFTAPGNYRALVSGLAALAERARYAAKSPRGPGPRKLAAKTAVRTGYIHELNGFLKDHFRKPLYAVIATTTNVMFEEYEKPLTAAHVRKLIHTSKKISSKSPS